MDAAKLRVCNYSAIRTGWHAARVHCAIALTLARVWTERFGVAMRAFVHFAVRGKRFACVNALLAAIHVHASVFRAVLSVRFYATILEMTLLYMLLAHRSYSRDLFALSEQSLVRAPAAGLRGTSGSSTAGRVVVIVHRRFVPSWVSFFNFPVVVCRVPADRQGSCTGVMHGMVWDRLVLSITGCLLELYDKMRTR